MASFRSAVSKPFGEPAVDRGEQRARLGGLALIPPQPGEAGGGAQFPRLRLLRTGALDRPPIGSFRPIRSARVAPQEQIADQPMVARLVGDKALPADVMAEIVERTDGIPLFVEEMTKAVLEAESEGAVRRMVAAVPSPALAVPASLHASLMARLDRLGPAKEVAQIGSAIGREFSHALLASV